jgi:hydrogenase expression/formation protein HypE
MAHTNGLRDTHIALAHGNGGRMMRELIEELFAPALANPQLDTGADAVPLPVPADHDLMVTTDGFTVKPLEFPGGNIGSLAVHGTVNDLAVCGAKPHYLTLNVFLEEGLEIALLRRVIDALAAAARDCGVAVVAGDTKVVGRGDCDGIYLATTGVGFRPRGTRYALDCIRAGDRILVSGPVGDHGTAVLLAREEFGLRGDLRSDSASVLPLTQALATIDGVRFMRDPTRGGLACSSMRRRFRSTIRSSRSASCLASIRCTWPAKDASWLWSPPKPQTRRWMCCGIWHHKRR